jgi:acetyl-CoA carboxylase biotin carboxyl carrier protein
MSKKKIRPTAIKATGTEKKNPANMKTNEIRDLIEFISQTGLNEVDIETKELKLHVKREPDQKIIQGNAAPVSIAPVSAAAPAAAPAVAPQAPRAEKSAPAAGKKMLEIKSPMIGTFYRSANPDSPAFASVGDKISKGQTVCIIEAMKLFNEIESEISGTITKVLCENASPVEYDQVLFVVEPD